jgi:hypothetical protein
MSGVPGCLDWNSLIGSYEPTLSKRDQNYPHLLHNSYSDVYAPSPGTVLPVVIYEHLAPGKPSQTRKTNEVVAIHEEHSCAGMRSFSLSNNDYSLINEVPIQIEKFKDLGRDFPHAVVGQFKAKDTRLGSELNYYIFLHYFVNAAGEHIFSMYLDDESQSGDVTLNLRKLNNDVMYGLKRDSDQACSVPGKAKFSIPLIEFLSHSIVDDAEDLLHSKNSMKETTRNDGSKKDLQIHSHVVLPHGHRAKYVANCLRFLSMPPQIVESYLAKVEELVTGLDAYSIKAENCKLNIIPPK